MASRAADAATGRVLSRRLAAGLVILSSLLYIGFAGTPALVDDDIDAAHALVAREMLQRRDFVTLYQDGIRYLIRPPLHFWLVAGSYALFGESAFATRLPVALAMVGLTLLIFAFGRRAFGAEAGFYAGLAVATSAGMYVFTRTVIPEAIYALEFTAIFYLFWRSWTGSLDPRVGYRGAAALAALAVLTRGPIGVLLPGAAVVAFLMLTGGWRRWRELRLPSSVAIFLAIAVPWHVLAEIRSPGFARVYLVDEHVSRAFGTRLPHDYGAVPLWLWWLEHLLWLFPWSVFAPLLAREIPARREWREGRPDAAARLLLLCWAGVILIFFSLESGSRMEYYSFGAWPALALLLGDGLVRGERDSPRVVRWGFRALAALGAIYAAAVAAFLVVLGRSARAGDLAADLRSRGTDFYRSAMARVLDLTPRALSDLRVPLVLSAVSLGLAFPAAAILRSRRRAVPSFVALALGMAGFFVAANVAYADLEVSFSSRGIAEEIRRSLRPDDRIVLLGDIRVAPGVAFYTGRRVLLWRPGDSNLVAGSRFPDAPKTFLTDAEFMNIWSGPRRVLLVVPADRNEEARRLLPAAGRRVFTTAGGKIVYENRPA